MRLHLLPTGFRFGLKEGIGSDEHAGTPDGLRGLIQTLIACG